MTKKLTKKEIQKHVETLIKSDKGESIYEFLIDHGVTECIARDWGNEERRRAGFDNRVFSRNKLPISYTRNHFGRRIIHEFEHAGRSYGYHATKGWRSFKLQTT